MTDFHQSSVNADAQNMYAQEMDSLGDTLEGADLFSVLMIIWDANDPGQEFNAWIQTSTLAKDLVECTQSDPQQSTETLMRMSELSEAINAL